MSSEGKKEQKRIYYLENKDKIIKRGKEHREKNKEAIRQARKERYQKNKEKIRKEQEEYQSRPEVKAKIRERKLIKIGWTTELYDKLMLEQKGVCAICKLPNTTVLAADHEHVVPPYPRGLLCSRCNVGLGQFLDNPILLMSAIVYLIKHGIKRQVSEEEKAEIVALKAAQAIAQSEKPLDA